MLKNKLNDTNAFQIYQIAKYLGILLINIFLAKTNLSTSDIGSFEFFMFIASSVSFFWITGITQTLLSHYHNLNNSKNSIFFSCFLLILTISVTSSVLVSFSFSLSSPELNHFYINLLIVYLVINPVGFIAEYILLLRRKKKNLIIFGISTFLVPAFLVTAPAILNSHLTFCFYGLIFWSSIKLGYVIRLIFLHSIININLKEIKLLFTKSIPLIGTALLAGSAAYIDGFIISSKYDSETFAIFRYGAKEFPLFVIMASSFSTSIIPAVAKKGNLENALLQIKISSKKMMHLFFPLAMVFLLISHIMYPWVFNESFSEAYEVFDIYLLLIISRFVFPQSILTGLQKYNVIFFISFIELLVNIAASLILIQYFGYIGVAYGTVIAYYFEKLTLSWFLAKRNNIKISKFIPVHNLIKYSVLLMLIYIVMLLYVK